MLKQIIRNTSKHFKDQFEHHKRKIKRMHITEKIVEKRLRTFKMAAATSISLNDKLIISELLCYLNYKFGKLSLVTLKCTIVDFCSAEKITEAKETIVKSVDELCIDKWPKPPKRRTDNKAAIEVDDLIGIFSYLDENALINKIPKFVAENIDNLPSTRI